jgi:hypothetical protein
MLDPLVSLLSQLQLASTNAKLRSPFSKLHVQIVQVSLLLFKTLLRILVDPANDHSFFSEVVLIGKRVNHLFAEGGVERM